MEDDGYVSLDAVLRERRQRHERERERLETFAAQQTDELAQYRREMDALELRAGQAMTQLCERILSDDSMVLFDEVRIHLKARYVKSGLFWFRRRYYVSDGTDVTYALKLGGVDYAVSFAPTYNTLIAREPVVTARRTTCHGPDGGTLYAMQSVGFRSFVESKVEHWTARLTLAKSIVRSLEELAGITGEDISHN